MDECEDLLDLHAWQIAQPRQSFISEPGTGRRRYFADCRPESGWGRRLGRKILERIGLDKHFIGVAHYTLPAQSADPVDDLDGTGSGIGQVSSVEHQVQGRTVGYRLIQPQMRSDYRECRTRLRRAFIAPFSMGTTLSSEISVLRQAFFGYGEASSGRY